MTCQICAKTNCIGECEPKIMPASTLEELYALSREVSAEQPAQPEPRIVQACDHSWNYEGHSHNDSLYVCSKCKKEEWR